MKFKGTISKIDEGGVRAKTDNPRERPVGYRHSMMSHVLDFENWLAELKWKEAEAQRKEYDIHSALITFNHQTKKAYIPSFFPPLEEGLRIEGEIIKDQIINVKII